MQISEMIYVLECEKGCKQNKGYCNNECKQCEFYLTDSTVCEAHDRIINLLDTISRKSTRQNF